MSETPPDGDAPITGTELAVVCLSFSLPVLFLGYRIADAIATYIVGGQPAAGWSPAQHADVGSMMSSLFLGLWSAFGAGLLWVMMPSDASPARMPAGWWPRLWRTVAAYAAVQVLMVLLRAALDTAGGAAPGPYPTGIDHLVLVVTLAAGGGPVEEPVFVALPFAVAALVLLRRRRQAGPAAARRRALWLLPAIIVVSSALRGALHLYQGWTAAGAAIVWGAGACLIYLRWRSVTGLIVGHIAFNVIFADLLARLDSPTIVYAAIALTVAAGLAAVLTPRKPRPGVSNAA